MKRTTSILLTMLAVTQAVPLHRAKRQILDLDDPAASNFTANEVCFYDNDIYQRGDTMPNPGPCEECKCEPPSIVCNMIKCPVNSGCRTIQRANHCCPDYKCECDHNGEIYSNGERLDTPDEPCQVCYCKGGEVMCTSISCYQRDDCEPQLVPGQCCPKYDHCPLRDMPSASENDENIIRNKTFNNSPKREMQPWLLTKTVYINTRPPMTTQRSLEEITTDKSSEEQTELIVSDWLTERRITTETENISTKPEESTSATTESVDPSFIRQDNQETSTTYIDESSTIVDITETTTLSVYSKSEQEKEVIVEETENQSEVESTTNFSSRPTTPLQDDETENTEGNDNSKSSENTSVSDKDTLNIRDLENNKLPEENIFTTENPKITSFEKSTVPDNESDQQDTQTEVDEPETMTSITEVDLIRKDIKNKSDDVNELDTQTENITGLEFSTEITSEGNSLNDFPDFEISQQKSTNEKRSGVNYEGSGEDPIEDENDTDSILHEELSGDLENIETTKFVEHSIIFTTPFTMESHIVEEANNKIKENSSVVNRLGEPINNPSLIEKQTEEPKISPTTNQYNSVSTTLPSIGKVEEDGTNQFNLKQSEVLSSTLGEDNVTTKVDEDQSGTEKIEIIQNSNSESKHLSSGNDLTYSESVTIGHTEGTIEAENSQSTQLETTTNPAIDINHSLKEVLTKEDVKESEMEEDSVEDKYTKVKENSEESESKGSNEEEGEDNQEPPVLELNNQLPFLQLGGHGSSESSSTPYSESSELHLPDVAVKEKMTETDEDEPKKNPSVRTVPESLSIEENTQPNTSSHITLTPGDLKILAEYLINEKIKPINRTSKNETLNYMPTEWLKGNLTSDVKIASILTAANINIGIMNKTNIESKLKSLEDVEQLISAGKNVEMKDSISNTEYEGNISKGNNKDITNIVEKVHEENKAVEERSTDKSVESSTIYTKLSLLGDESTSALENEEPKHQDENINLLVVVKQETNTEKINLESDISEVATTKYSESINNSTINEMRDNTKTEQIMTTIIPETFIENRTKNSPDAISEIMYLKGKNSDISASRKVRIPERESIVQEPFSVNLEDNDITIVRDFLQKHMMFP